MNTTPAFRPIEYAKDTRPRTHRLGDFLRGTPTVGLDGRWREERADGDDGAIVEVVLKLMKHENQFHNEQKQRQNQQHLLRMRERTRPQKTGISSERCPTGPTTKPSTCKTPTVRMFLMRVERLHEPWI